MQEEPRKMMSGGRNLLLLGILSVLIACATTGVSLAIYHNSGDIYLDRSRPGYLPDEEEIEQEDEVKQDEVYDFSKTGTVTVEGLTEYLDRLAEEMKAIDAYADPFGAEVLSDEHFGIPE